MAGRRDDIHGRGTYLNPDGSLTSPQCRSPSLTAVVRFGQPNSSGADCVVEALRAMLEAPQEGAAVTGPEHYQLSEQMLEHAASMLSTDVAPEDRAELIERQAAVAAMATAHAVLAAAASLGLGLHLGRPDERAWHATAATPIDS